GRKRRHARPRRPLRRRCASTTSASSSRRSANSSSGAAKLRFCCGVTGRSKSAAATSPRGRAVASGFAAVPSRSISSFASMIHVGIVSVGLCTPLGFDRETTVREISAGSDAFEERHVLDAVGAPERACASPLLPRSATRMQRMKALAVAALDEPLAVALHLGATRLPLALGLPEPNGAGAIEPETLLLALRERAEALGIVIEDVPGALHIEGRD